MTLLTEHTDRIPSSVGKEGGDNLGGGFAVLDPEIYRDMRWCANCGGEQTFVPVYEMECGRLGYCLGCGEEKVVPFTRTNSEAA
jgi:hypothetical protein